MRRMTSGNLGENGMDSRDSPFGTRGDGFQGFERSGVTPFNPKLGVDMLKVLLHRGRADAQDDGGLKIGLPLRNPQQNFRLTRRKAQPFQWDGGFEIGGVFRPLLRAFEPRGDGFQ